MASFQGPKRTFLFPFYRLNDSPSAVLSGSLSLSLLPPYKSSVVEKADDKKVLMIRDYLNSPAIRMQLHCVI